LIQAYDFFVEDTLVGVIEDLGFGHRSRSLPLAEADVPLNDSRHLGQTERTETAGALDGVIEAGAERRGLGDIVQEGAGLDELYIGGEGTGGLKFDGETAGKTGHLFAVAADMWRHPVIRENAMT
jgi:hypothetical protein